MQHFCIIAMQRSGSTRLCDILCRHPAIACHQEIFNADGVQAHLPRDLGLDVMSGAFRDANHKLFLDRFLAFNEDWFRGRKCHGFKAILNRDQLPAIMTSLVPDPRLKKIVLYRDNLLACYASLRLTAATGVWHRTDNGEVSTDPAPKLTFKWDDFFALAGEQLMTRAAVEQALLRSHQNFLPISYEETLTARGMERVWDFLNVPASLDSGVYQQTNTRPLLDCFSDPETVIRVARQIGRPDWLQG